MTDATRDQVHVEHMLECIQRVDRYVDTDKEQFFKNIMLQDAVMRVLQVMAESSQRLSKTTREAHSNIDWRAISGFRNILVHDYLGGIDLELIWQVIEQELPRLKHVLLQMQEEY